MSKEKLKSEFRFLNLKYVILKQITKFQDGMLRASDKIFKAIVMKWISLKAQIKELKAQAQIKELKAQMELFDPDAELGIEALPDTKAITTLAAGEEIFDDLQWKEVKIDHDWMLLECPECGELTAADPLDNIASQECYYCDTPYFIPDNLKLQWFLQQFKKTIKPKVKSETT